MKHKATAMLLVLAALVQLLAVGVLADDSTTTWETCHKDEGANTEIYMVTDEPDSDYRYYGALYEPTGGVYYGRVCDGGMVDQNTYGAVNQAQLADESAVSFYTYLSDPYSMEYWSYLYGPVIADGEHVLLMNLNFLGEGADCPAVLDGSFDSKLIADFQWLSRLSCPVLMRIGGEVNVWDDRPDAWDYIAAYRHIAALARRYCPNVALVYSPSCSSDYGTDLDTYYPGDDYVDWIGASLYYNCYAGNGDTENDAFYGVGIYADAVLNLQQVVNLSDLHEKPVLVTEGGSAKYQQGIDLTDFAASHVHRAYAYLSMIYPQVKCLIYSDTNFGDTETLYSIHDNAAITAAYDASVAANPTLLHTWQGTAKYYTRVADYTGDWAGEIQLAAYTNTCYSQSASWYLDGVWQEVSYDYPYFYSFNADALTEGVHTVRVVFSNGDDIEYAFIVYRGSSPFRDVRLYDAYYYTPVLWAAARHITNGTDDTHFSPDQICTRGQVITFLWRAAGCPEPQYGWNPFYDVDSTAYYYKAVLWGYQNGIVCGIDEHTFGAESYVTRGQFITFLYRYAGKPAVPDTYCPLTDIAAGQYYTDAVHWGYQKGIVTGLEPGVFGPEAGCSRGQVATFLWRYMGR